MFGLSSCALPPLRIRGRVALLHERAGRNARTQLNYRALGDSLGLHRATAQRLTSDLLAQIAAFVLAGAALQVRRSSTSGSLLHACGVDLGAVARRPIAAQRAACAAAAVAGRNLGERVRCRLSCPEFSRCTEGRAASSHSASVPI